VTGRVPMAVILFFGEDWQRDNGHQQSAYGYRPGKKNT